MENYEIQTSSAGWLFYVKASFVIAVAAVVLGVVFSPGSFLVKGYFSIASLFLVSSTITLSKTMRDEHESGRLINKIASAKTSKIIQEYAQ